MDMYARLRELSEQVNALTGRVETLERARLQQDGETGRTRRARSAPGDASAGDAESGAGQ